MKVLRIIGALAIGLIAGAGCETDTDVDSATQAEIQIHPNYVSLAKGQAAEFTASGWYEYAWTLAYPDWGTLTHRTGNKTVYTAVIKTNGMQTLTCSANIATTNNTSTVTAQALIQQH